MATKTFEELKQMAIQIRDEKANKQNTATRIGTQMLEHLNKLEQDFLDKDTTEDKFSELKNNTQYVECNTSASIVNKTIYLKGFILSKGIRMLIKFTEINTAENATLNITETGDKPIYFNGSIVSSTNTWEAGDILDVYYDGANYQATINKVYYGNISLQYTTNKVVTRRLVPKAFRRTGLQITFEDPNDGFVTETYIGKEPTNTSNYESDANWERTPKDKTIQEAVDNAKSEILNKVSIIERELILEKTITSMGFNRIPLDNPIPANTVFLIEVKGVPSGGQVNVKYDDEDGSTVVFDRIIEDKSIYVENDKEITSLVLQLLGEEATVTLTANYPSDYDLEVLRSQTSDKNSEDYIRLRNLVRVREKSTYNIYNINDYTSGYIDINNGKPVSASSVGYSSPICVFEAKFFNTYSLSGNVQFMMYDKDDNYLGYKQINTGGKWVKTELLPNTTFIRFSGMNNTNPNIQIYVYVDCLETRKIPYGVSHKQAIINSFLLAPIVELWGDSLGATQIGRKMKELLGIEVINHSFGGTLSGFIRQRFIEAQENLQAPHIFWIGTNNQYAPYKVVDDVRRMVRELGHNKFLVLTPLPGSQNSLESVQKVLDAEKMLEEAFGTRCLNIRKAFIGLYDMGNVQLKNGTLFLQPDLNGTIDVQLANPTDVHFLKYINSSYRNDANRNYILMDIYGSGTKIDDLCKYEIVYPYTIDSEGGYTKAEGDTDNYEEGIIKLKLLYVPDSISSGDRGSIGYNVENKVVTQTPTGSSTPNTFIDRVRFYKFLDCKCMWEIGGTAPSATSDIIHPYTTNGGDAIGEIIAYKFAELLA